MIDWRTTSIMPGRCGFTLIEAIVVVAIVILLTAITVPGSVAALRTGRVNQGVGILDTANSDAQRFARASDGIGLGNQHYGVRITGDTPPHKVAVIYGTPGTATPIDGLEKNLNAGVLFYNGNSPLSGSIEWYYQYGTGFPVAAGSTAGPTISIGNTGSPITEELSVRSRDGTVTIRCRIYEVALFFREEF